MDVQTSLPYGATQVNNSNKADNVNVT